MDFPTNNAFWVVEVDLDDDVDVHSEYGGGHRGRGGAVADVGGGGAGLLTGTMWPEKLILLDSSELNSTKVLFLVLNKIKVEFLFCLMKVEVY